MNTKRVLWYACVGVVSEVESYYINVLGKDIPEELKGRWNHIVLHKVSDEEMIEFIRYCEGLVECE